MLIIVKRFFVNLHCVITASDSDNRVIMATLWNRAGHYIFALWFLSFFLFPFFFLFSSPNLSGRRLDVYHTSTHGVALVRI